MSLITLDLHGITLFGDKKKQIEDPKLVPHAGVIQPNQPISYSQDFVTFLVVTLAVVAILLAVANLAMVARGRVA